ncbi:putative beta-amyrin synthase [Helianthus annuus]|nr:putative beta-amyrin synthase [Helianthus annuus]
MHGVCFKKHLARIPYYLWVVEDKNENAGHSFHSEEWDVGFAIQALLATDLTEEIRLSIAYLIDKEYTCMYRLPSKERTKCIATVFLLYSVISLCVFKTVFS